jgi:hypothetical protein
MMKRGKKISGAGRGLTIVESMMLLVTMSIIAVAAGVGLQAVAKVPGQTDDMLAVNAAVIDRMERMRAEPWATMGTKATALTNTSPGISINNKYYPCTVTKTDIDPDGSGATDFRMISVTIGSQTMSVYACSP